MRVGSSEKTTLTFSEEDLPSEGIEHTKPLYITICKELRIPVVLVDNRLALNVCHLRTATCLRVLKEELTPSTMTVRV